MDEEPKFSTSQKINLAVAAARAQFEEDVRRIVAAMLDSNNDIIFRFMDQLAQDQVDVKLSSTAQQNATLKSEWKAKRTKNK